MPALFTIVPEIPRKFLAPVDINDAFQEAMDAAANDALKEFQATVATWDKKPGFRISRGKYTRTIYTENRIWNLVDKGAKAHKIPKRPFTKASRRYLRFQTTYQAKTIPGKADSYAGGASGPYVRKRQVNHPGFQGRKFSTTITDIMQEKLEHRVELAILQLTGRIRF